MVPSILCSARHCSAPDSLLCNHGPWTLFYHLCPSQPAYPCSENREYQSLSILLGTLDNSRWLLRYCSPLSWSSLGMHDYARIGLEPTWTAHMTTFYASSKGPAPVSDEPCESWDVPLYQRKREVNTSLVGSRSPPWNHVGHSALSCQSSSVRSSKRSSTHGW
jgi:hypothetical protein